MPAVPRDKIVQLAVQFKVEGASRNAEALRLVEEMIQVHLTPFRRDSMLATNGQIISGSVVQHG